MHEVVITGMGLLLPQCDSRERFWQQLRDGESQLSPEPNPANPREICAMGRICDFDPGNYLYEFPRRFYSRYPRDIQLYLSSLLLARNDAGLDLTRLDTASIGLFSGSSRGSFGFWYERIREERERPGHELYTRLELALATPGQAASLAAALLRISGPTYSFNNSCTSGAVAIGHAWRELQSGEIEVAFASGHDSALVAPLYHMYKDSNLLSAERTDARRAVRPYVGHSTNAFGEGAVTLVLETRAHAERRGARVLATLGGYRYGNNGEHPTHVDISGTRPAQIINRLLQGSDVSAEQIDFVVGHGNAVESSDVAEMNYMRRVFGTRSSAVPLISTKPIYGHTLGASSAMNIAAAALMLQQCYLVPTINIDEQRIPPGVNLQANRGQPQTCIAGIAVSFGLGGHNTATLVRRYAEQS